MFKNFLLMSGWFRDELEVYKKVVFDRRTPFLAKACYGLLIGYAIFPFDFISDFIPILGQVDDIILIPVLFIIARTLTPKQVIQEYRREVTTKNQNIIKK